MKRRYLPIALVIFVLASLACNAVKVSYNIGNGSPEQTLSSLADSQDVGEASIEIVDSAFVNGEYPASKEYFSSSAPVSGNTVGYVANLYVPADTSVKIDYVWSVVHIPGSPKYDGQIMAQNSDSGVLDGGKTTTVYSNFILNVARFPPGTYQLELYINGTLRKQRQFEVLEQ